MTINDLMEKYKMNRMEISKRLKISYRNVQKWALPEENPEHRRCPDYALRMMLAILENDLEVPDLPEE